MTHYFLFAGESSGDRHGSHLIKALRQIEIESIRISGVGGVHMREAGMQCEIETEQFQVMGFTKVLFALPRLLKLFYRVRDMILQSKPNCVILIDYPGFNLRLARALRAKQFQGKIVQYICPSVWAHGKQRIKTLERNYDLLLTIFPFELDCFANSSLAVKYVGNPSVQTILHNHYHSNWINRVGLKSTDDLIALFPGSRPHELHRHLPQQLAAAYALQQNYPHLQFAISCSHEKLRSISTKFIQKSAVRNICIVPPQYTYELMRACHTAIAKSGTVTLELALHEVPTVVHYNLSLGDYLIAKHVLRLHLPYYCIVNILQNKQIYPELIDHNLSTEKLTEQISQVYAVMELRQHIISACRQLKHHLGSDYAHNNAAQAIKEMIKC